jgi:hypothetical protein
LAEYFAARVSDAEEKKTAAAARERPPALEPREAMDQSKARESVEPKLPAAVSSAGMEKTATPEKEKQAEPQPRETMARPKVRESATHELQAAESVPAKSTSVISQSNLDQQAAFLEKAREAFAGITNKVWLSGAIPPEKARAATKAYAPNVSPDAIMLLYDGTVWGGAKDGLLLTVDTIYWHLYGGEADHCRYADIQEISHDGALRLNEKKVGFGDPRCVEVLLAVMNLIRSWKTHLA